MTILAARFRQWLTFDIVTVTVIVAVAVATTVNEIKHKATRRITWAGKTQDYMKFEYANRSPPFAFLYGSSD